LPHGRGDDAVNFLLAHSDAKLVMPAVDIRSASEPTVWRSAYTALAGNPFESQDPAAALLMRTGHPAEALAFLDELVRAVPWNAGYRIRLAQERAEINRDLGMAFERTGALGQALPYWQRAYRLESDPAVKAQINKEVQQIRLVQRRREANRARQPEIHSELEQAHVVRPRLSEPALSTPPRQQGPQRKGAGL
jgi:tetratricopeptide (TPR) repeat protein